MGRKVKRFNRDVQESQKLIPRVKEQKFTQYSEIRLLKLSNSYVNFFLHEDILAYDLYNP